MRKRVRALLLVVCLVLGLMIPAKAAGTVLEVDAPETLLGIGETFTVTVNISGNPGINAVQMTLAYDETVLDCTRARVGDALSGSLSAANPDASDGARVAAASVDALTEDGVLATFTFTVKGSGTPEFSLLDTMVNQGSEPVNFTVTGAKLEESKPEPVEPAPAPAPEEEPEEEELPAVKDPEEELPAEETDSRFTDTTGHVNEFYINEAVDRGFFQGYADGSFKPDGSVTRGAFVTVLWRMAGKPMPNQAAPFTDIGKVSTEFQLAIAWAYENGYINGRTATTFAPSDPVSRQATMKILFHLYGGGSGAEVMFTGIYDDYFEDSGSLTDQFKAPMYWGVYNELIEAKTEQTLSGASVADRALLASVLVKYTDRFGA